MAAAIAVVTWARTSRFASIAVQPLAQGLHARPVGRSRGDGQDRDEAPPIAASGDPRHVAFEVVANALRVVRR